MLLRVSLLNTTFNTACRYIQSTHRRAICCDRYPLICLLMQLSCNEQYAYTVEGHQAKAWLYQSLYSCGSCVWGVAGPCRGGSRGCHMRLRVERGSSMCRASLLFVHSHTHRGQWSRITRGSEYVSQWVPLVNASRAHTCSRGVYRCMGSVECPHVFRPKAFSPVVSPGYRMISQSLLQKRIVDQLNASALEHNLNMTFCHQVVNREALH